MGSSTSGVAVSSLRFAAMAVVCAIDPEPFLLLFHPEIGESRQLCGYCESTPVLLQDYLLFIALGAMEPVRLSVQHVEPEV